MSDSSHFNKASGLTANFPSGFGGWLSKPVLGNCMDRMLGGTKNRITLVEISEVERS